MKWLKQHPFAVEAHFRQSLVLTFALPAQDLIPLLPPPLRLDTHEGHGFVAVAMVQTEKLRPKGFPQWLGNDFFLVGYRIFTRFTNQAGKRLRGLYILESQTNHQKMVLLGNLMTHYRYSRVSVRQTEQGGTYSVSSVSEGFALAIERSEAPTLPEESVFTDWKQARRFAGPLPFTFTYLAESNEVLVVQGVRSNWTPTPVTVTTCNLPWLSRRGFGHAKLSSAFVVKDIPYHWKRGVIEKWES
ncbi:MAG: DUF2071 domain-containing protein [Bacteroidota bacterium]